MSSVRIIATGLFVFALAFAASPATAQQVYVTTPLISAGDSFYEWFGLDWGFHFRSPTGSVFFHWGGANSTIPPFGGFDPNSIARFGFAQRGRNGELFFNLAAGQGSRRSIVSAAPSIMLPNGGVGSVQDVSIRPFVTGVVPIVGSGGLVSPLAERVERLRAQQPRGKLTEAGSAKKPNDLTLVGQRDGVVGEHDVRAVPTPQESTAEHGDISVAEIRRWQATQEQAQQQELADLIQQAQAAEGAGRYGVARIRYGQAASRATGRLKQDLLEKLDSLKTK